MHKVEVKCSCRKFLVLKVIVEVDAIAKSNLCMRRVIRYNFSVFFLPTNRIIYLWLCLCEAKLYLYISLFFEYHYATNVVSLSSPSPLPKVTKIPL